MVSWAAAASNARRPRAIGMGVRWDFRNGEHDLFGAAFLAENMSPFGANGSASAQVRHGKSIRAVAAESIANLVKKSGIILNA